MLREALGGERHLSALFFVWCLWGLNKRERRPDQLGLTHGQLRCGCSVSMSHGLVRGGSGWDLESLELLLSDTWFILSSIPE